MGDDYRIHITIIPELAFCAKVYAAPAWNCIHTTYSSTYNGALEAAEDEIERLQEQTITCEWLGVDVETMAGVAL